MPGAGWMDGPRAPSEIRKRVLLRCGNENVSFNGVFKVQIVTQEGKVRVGTDTYLQTIRKEV